MVSIYSLPNLLLVSYQRQITTWHSTGTTSLPILRFRAALHLQVDLKCPLDLPGLIAMTFNSSPTQPMVDTHSLPAHCSQHLIHKPLNGAGKRFSARRRSSCLSSANPHLQITPGKEVKSVMGSHLPHGDSLSESRSNPLSHKPPHNQIQHPNETQTWQQIEM